MRHPVLRAIAGALVLLVAAGTAPFAQGAPPRSAHPQASASRYARAESFLGANVQRLVSGNQLEPRWFDGDRFWFRGSRGLGREFIVVDPVRGTRSVAPPDFVIRRPR